MNCLMEIYKKGELNLETYDNFIVKNADSLHKEGNYVISL